MLHSSIVDQHNSAIGLHRYHCLAHVTFLCICDSVRKTSVAIICISLYLNEVLRSRLGVYIFPVLVTGTVI